MASSLVTSTQWSPSSVTPARDANLKAERCGLHDFGLGTGVRNWMSHPIQAAFTSLLDPRSFRRVAWNQVCVEGPQPRTEVRGDTFLDN